MENVFGLIGFLFPPAIDLINRYVKNSDLRFWVSVLFCIAVGSLAAFLKGNLTVDFVAMQAMVYVGEAQLAYKLWGQSSERTSLNLTGGSRANGVS